MSIKTIDRFQTGISINDQKGEIRARLQAVCHDGSDMVDFTQKVPVWERRAKQLMDSLGMQSIYGPLVARQIDGCDDFLAISELIFRRMVA